MFFRRITFFFFLLFVFITNYKYYDFSENLEQEKYIIYFYGIEIFEIQN